MPTPSEIFTEINTRLAADPSKVGSTTGKFLFDLSGDEGGQYHLALEQGAAEAGEGAIDNPNTTIRMAAGDFVDLATGKLNGTTAFMSGKLKIQGDMGLAMKLQQVLNAAR